MYATFYHTSLNKTFFVFFGKKISEEYIKDVWRLVWGII